MNIVHIVTSFNVGGMETMLVDIINQQVKTHPVSLIILNRRINSALITKISHKVKVFKINRKKGSKNPLCFIKFNYLLYKISPDIIHCHAGGIIKYIKIIKKYKIYCTIHDVYVEGFYLKNYDNIFAISKSVQKDLKKRLSLDSIVIYNGIDTKKMKNKKNYNYDIFKIVCVSRLQYAKKGQDTLIKAVHNLVNKMNVKNIQIDFIGEGNSYDYLKELVITYKLSHYINFLGLKDREYIYSHIKDYELLVQPSNFEGFGLTVTEAMAAKVPVLVSNVEGPMEIVNNGEFGFYFSKGDENDLAVKINNIMGNYNSDTIQKIIVDAYQRIINDFDIRSTAKNYIENYLCSPCA